VSLTFDPESQLLEIHRFAFGEIPVRTLIIPAGKRRLSGLAFSGSALESLLFVLMSMNFFI
jgi:hypothetical protein